MSHAATIERAFAEAMAGRPRQGETILRAALKAFPRSTELLHALARVHWSANEVEQAAGVLIEAEATAPRDLTIKLDLARALWNLGRLPDAAAVYEQVIALAPDQPAAYDEAAKVQLTAARFDEAWAIYARGVRALPGSPHPFVQWVNAAIKAGEVDQAVAAARAGVAACPDDPAAILQLCVALAFADNPDAAEQTALHRRLGELTASRSPRTAQPFPNSRDPNRRLRVAFMSGDFRFHACAFFMAGPLMAFDRARVEPFCYALNAPDQITPNFAQIATFRDLSAVSDDQISAHARADGIDILIDCFGWSAGHRMTALCPRIAPVQVNYLGYSNTTGLPTMDYRLVDAATDPPGAEGHATEKLLRLPGCFVCFTPPEYAPEPQLSPALAAYESGKPLGPVTFGCFNRLEKAQAKTLACWAAILNQTPGASLLLKDDATPGMRASVERRFSAAGGDVSRLRWTPYQPDPAQHLAAHHQMDIALDPFPYNGTTTTCEALLMGVPVVALAGGVHRARVGVSLLRTVGLSDLIAPDEAAYIAIATRLAADPSRLLDLHKALRLKLLRSSLCSATRYAADFEAALRTAWTAWCVS